MKHLCFRAAAAGMVAFALPLASLTSIYAQDSPAPGAGQPPHRENLEARLSFFKTKLSLSDDQVAQLKTIFTDQKAQVDPIRQDTTLSAEQKKAKVKPILEATRAKVDAILTPDQKAKLDEMRKAAIEKRKQKNS